MKFAGRIMGALAVMLMLSVQNVCAVESEYIMPFEGEDVQILNVYTGDPIKFKCDIEGGLYTWYASHSGSGGASMIYYDPPSEKNTYTLTSKAAWYYQDYRVSVSVEKDGETYKSKTYKINVLYSKGDVNGDAKVNNEDAALLLKYLCGSEKLDEKQLYAAAAADETRSEPDIRDAVWIMQNSRK